MHRKRQAVSTRVPIPRKGTAYVVRPSSHLDSSIPVLLAVRDMLQLAKTAKDVKHIIKTGAIKINGKDVTDLHASIRLFNILQADKSYKLSLLKTGKFHFEELTGKSDNRIVKIVGKKVLSKSKIQYHFHDGTNALISDNSLSVGDSIKISFDGKLVSHIPFKKGSNCFISSGKYSGYSGKIVSADKASTIISLTDLNKEVTLPFNSIILT